MAKEKTVLIDAGAMAKMDWENEKKRLAFFAKLGAAPSGASVWAQLSTGVWNYGRINRTNGTNVENYDDCFDAFAAGRKVPGGGGALTKDSATTYRSIVNTIGTAAQGLAYDDGGRIIGFVSSKMGSVAFGSRAAIVKRIVETHAKSAPTDSELDGFLPVKVANLSDELASITKRLVAIGTADDTAKAITAHGLADTFKATLAKAQELSAASAKVIPVTPTKARGKTLSPEAAALVS